MTDARDSGPSAPAPENAGAPPRVNSLLLDLARRRAGGAQPGSALQDLIAGDEPAAVAAGRGLPPAAVAGIAGFYDLLNLGPQVCDGTACHFAGRERLVAALGADGAGTVRCLGYCYAAPSLMVGDHVFALPRGRAAEEWFAHRGESDGDPHTIPRRSLAPRPVVLRNLLPGGPAPGPGEYDLPDGDAILAALEAAKLRGRGGAAFPTAAKWRAARETPAEDRWVVANGDEGDPGSFVDRLLLEEDPHAVLAGMVACARVIGARRGIVYVRGEYPRARRRVREAIADARAAGHLGRDFDVELFSGAGSYVCGEETALLNSILGLRGEPRLKPPYPSEAGLHGLPTVVQNVETLSLIPWVARSGVRTGTKALSLSGAVAEPGVYEIELGTPLSRVLEAAGGAPEGRRWSMALVGGPMGRVLPRSAFEAPLSFEQLLGLGHGGIVMLDESVSPRMLAEHLFEFARAESCGYCTPCRAGTQRLHELRDRPALERLLETIGTGSMCGFGQGVPRPIRDLLEHFGEAVLR